MREGEQRIIMKRFRSSYDKPTKYFASTVLILFVFFAVSSVLAFLGAGSFVEKWIVKLAGKFDIFKVWLSLAYKLFRLDSFQLDAGWANLFNDPNAIFNGAQGFLSGFLVVLANAFFDTLLSAIFCTFLKQACPIKADLLEAALGVTLGLITSMLLSQTKRKGLLTIFSYSTVTIGLLLFGLVTLVKLSLKTSLFHLSQEDKINLRLKYIGPIIAALPVPIATTGYATVTCLVASGTVEPKIGMAWQLVVSIVYLAILLCHDWVSSYVFHLVPPKRGKYKIEWTL